MHLTVCSQCNVIKMSELFTSRYVQYIVIGKSFKQQSTHLRLRVCIEAKSGHFKLKL